MLSCALVTGRSSSTAGLRLAAQMGCPTSTDSIDAVANSDIDVVFDASNAAAHPAHWADLTSVGVLLVNLTPSGGGTMVAPTINGHRAESSRYLSLVSCGGQAVLPVLNVVARHCTPRYIKVVTTVAAASVGRATLLNLDEYIATTEYAMCRLTHVPDVKVLTSISPALPAPVFRAQISVAADDIRPEPLRAGVETAATAVHAFGHGNGLGASRCRLDGRCWKTTPCSPPSARPSRTAGWPCSWRLGGAQVRTYAGPSITVPTLSGSPPTAPAAGPPLDQHTQRAGLLHRPQHHPGPAGRTGRRGLHKVQPERC